MNYVDQSYSQGNILDIALWLGQYHDNYCPVVYTADYYRYTWPSGQTQTPHL